MVMNNDIVLTATIPPYAPFADPALLGIIYRVEIPDKKKQLIDSLTVLSQEWYQEIHSQQYWEAGKVIGDFMKCHLL